MEVRWRQRQDVPVLADPTDCCRLWLFRHPELDVPHSEIVVGAGPADLGRRGRAQVLRMLELCKNVKLAEVHCSPQPQCLGPARALAEAQELEARPDERLRDQEMGRWQGRRWSEIARDEDAAVRTFFSEFGEAKAPGGENLGDATERMLAWWVEWMPKVLGKSLVVVVPGVLLSGFAAAMLGMRLARSISLNLPLGGLGVLDVFQNGARVMAWNPDAMARE
ncbi:MAG TPA: histidine phosphatase family protein [Planctomycetota bacterium]|nr:histidine phosphatase family protein [Planctomycetota bacterium]